MDLRAGHRRATGLLRTVDLIHRHRQRGGLDLAEPEGQFAHRAGRHIDLASLGVVDDFPVVEVTRGHLGKLLQQHHRDREIAAGEHATVGLARGGVDLGVVVVGQPGGAHHHMRAMRQRLQDVVLGDVRLGVLDVDVIGRGAQRLDAGGGHAGGVRMAGHLRQRLPGGTAREAGYQRHVRRVRHAARQFAAGPAGDAAYRNANPIAHRHLLNRGQSA
ncbi:hypothetical protein D3C85_1287510 [compost metagenome]